MSDFAETIGRAPAASTSIDPQSFWSLAAFVDLASVGLAAAVAEVGYNALAHGWLSIGFGGMRLAVVVAAVFVIGNVVRRRYALSDYLDHYGHARRAAGAWNVAFMSAALLGFLDRGHGDVSRGAYLTFYIVGLAFVMATRAGLATWTRWKSRMGLAVVARAILIGTRADVESPARRSELREAGLSLERAVTLSDDPEERAAELAEAVKLARRQRVAQVVVAAPICRGDLIEACLAAFLKSPIEVRLKLSPSSRQNHLAAERLSAAIGDISLRRPASLSEADRFIKRLSDIVLGAAALIAFAPVMIGVAIAIKFDSPGPVFFVQTRRGYNKQLFRIVKFRTMTAIENRRTVTQAKARDCRVTRMGRWMRRYNVDELPQLFNVLRGNMSLVGPRPHAIPHDRQFAREIDFYVRRNNMLPGMTGWAQVNGHRGAIESPEHIERRVAHDLHYIDNWSLALDLWILVMTLFSRNAYRNAF